MMTQSERDAFEADGFRTEAAVQFGFQWTNDDADEYACTEAQLIAFARGCERAGMYQAMQIVRAQEKITGDQHEAVVLGDIAGVIEVRIGEIDAELKPILEAERRRSLTASGYVPIDAAKPEGGWIKPESPPC